MTMTMTMNDQTNDSEGYGRLVNVTLAIQIGKKVLEVSKELENDHNFYADAEFDEYPEIRKC